MKKLLLIAVFLLSCTDSKSSADKERQCPTISVKFSPKGGITESLVEGIDSAQSEVRVQAFSFTSVPIADALIRKHKQGKEVEVLLDREPIHNKNSVLSSLYQAGIPVYIDSRHAIAHNKIIIIDDNKVFTGSFNFSRGAEEHNAENSIMPIDRNTTSLYLENYTLHKEHSNKYSPDR